MAKITAYDRALVVAKDLQKALCVHDRDCRTTIVWVNGKKRFGYRVTITRLSDGTTSSDFVWGEGTIK